MPLGLRAMGWPRRTAGLAVALVAIAAPATASAAPTWLAPTKLSAEGSTADEVQVAADAQGDDLAVWRRFDTKAGQYVIEASSRPAGTGPWLAAVPITDGKEEVFAPQVAMDAHGDAVVAWVGNDGNYTIQAAQRAGLSGAFSKAVQLKNLGPMKVVDQRPDLAMNSRGDTVAAWLQYNGATAIVESASKPAGGSWGADETISSEAEEMSAPEVGIDATGGATALWEQVVEAKLRATVSARSGSGKWAAPAAISPLTEAAANLPQLAVNAAGDAVAVWEHFYGSEGQENVEVASRIGPTGSWSKASVLTKLEAPKGEPGPHAVAIDAHGDAVAVWSRITESTNEIIEAAVGKGGAWQVPEVLTSGLHKGGEITPQVAVDESGDAVVVIEQIIAGKEQIEAITGNAVLGGWGKPKLISAAGESAHEPQIALDAQGNAAAVWTREDGKGASIAEAAGYDASGPQLGGLSIPSAGAIGQTLSFSVSPLDAWSNLGTTTWSFGDGASATGTAVTHAYAAGGAFTVTVTGTDVLGNRTSTTGVVAIALPPGHSTPFKPPAVRPRISSAFLTHTHFRVSGEPTAVSARKRAPLGTAFRFTLNEAASLRVTIERSVGGLRSGRRCLAPSAKLRRHHAKRCQRTVAVGALSRAKQPSGAGMLAFSGRIGKKPLSPGAYKAVLGATAQGLASAPVTLALTIVR